MAQHIGNYGLKSSLVAFGSVPGLHSYGKKCLQVLLLNLTHHTGRCSPERSLGATQVLQDAEPSQEPQEPKGSHGGTGQWGGPAPRSTVGQTLPLAWGPISLTPRGLGDRSYSPKLSLGTWLEPSRLAREPW